MNGISQVIVLALPFIYEVGFFFFQAEDGIRDLTVTGVQTCALPISNAYCGQLLGTQQYRDAFFGTGLDGSLTAGASSFFGASGSPQRAIVINALVMNEIGRASL